jgi:GNAT superfamily N-acetyltransferase
MRRLLPFRLHDIVILRSDRSLRAPVGDLAFGLQEHSASGTLAVTELHRCLGHRIAAERVEKRFGQGLRFLVLMLGDRPVASTWIVPGGQARYIDELGWRFPLAPTEFWVRDVFVSPGARGHGIFATFIDLIASGGADPCTIVWSDVDADNPGSLRAHARAGFTVWTRTRALDFRGRLRWRGRPPAWHLPITGLEPAHHLLRLQGATLQSHLDWVA